MEKENFIAELQELRTRNKELEIKVIELEKLHQQTTTVNEQLTAHLKEKSNQHIIVQKQFNALADNIPVIVWTAEADGSLDYYNQRWFDYTGQTFDEAKGWGWEPVLHPEDLQRTIDTWNNSLASSTAYQIEYRFKRASDGEYRWHLGKASPFLDENGQVVKWFGTNTDIHEQKKAEQKKDEFISIASHELKTPLTTVKAYIQICKRGMRPTDPFYTYINKADEQLLRLEKLIADLLDVSKINAGKLVYNTEEFNFNDILKYSVDAVQHISPQHQISIEQHVDVTFKGDKQRLEQVLNNLLTNAIKYSPQANKIIVRSELNQDNIIISVQDFGIGIAPENLSKLFNRFYRIDNTSMRFQGLGLGLYIAAEIIKRHNGSFWIESEPEQGSTFYFLLPIYGKYTLKQLASDDKTFYKANYIEIQYNKEDNRLEVDWLGYQNFESVKTGCLIMLDLLQKNNCSKVLNDNTHVLGNWSEAVDWGAQVWFPAMEKAGLKHFAWIYSPSTFSRMSAEKSVDITMGNIVAQFFTDKTSAQQWLENL